MFPNRKCDSDLPGDAFAVETVLQFLLYSYFKRSSQLANE
jgi:hypothetical protein